LEKSAPYAADSSGLSFSSFCRLSLAKNNNVNYELMCPRVCVCACVCASVRVCTREGIKMFCQ